MQEYFEWTTRHQAKKDQNIVVWMVVELGIPSYCLKTKTKASQSANQNKNKGKQQHDNQKLH